jgi:hypothetical protein
MLTLGGDTSVTLALTWSCRWTIAAWKPPLRAKQSVLIECLQDLRLHHIHARRPPHTSIVKGSSFATPTISWVCGWAEEIFDFRLEVLPLHGKIDVPVQQSLYFNGITGFTIRSFFRRSTT